MNNLKLVVTYPLSFFLVGDGGLFAGFNVAEALVLTYNYVADLPPAASFYSSVKNTK